MKVTEDITLIKEVVLQKINSNGLTYEDDFYDEPGAGYCHSITTEYASGLMSDAPDGILKMYIFDNNMYNWAVREGLSDNQIGELSLYIPIFSLDDFIEYLTTKKLKPID